MLVADVAGHRQAGPLFQVERHCQGRHDGAGVDPDRVGLEIADELADCPDSLVLDQVSAGVAVRMAVLYLLATR